MTRDAISNAVVTAVTEVSAMNGHEVTVDEATAPFDLPDFDSITSVEVLVQICKKLTIEIEQNPFLPAARSPVSNIGTVIDIIHDAVKGRTT